MTNVTREELEACARLIEIGQAITRTMPYYELFDFLSIPKQQAALARESPLLVDFSLRRVTRFKPKFEGVQDYHWPNDGTEQECIIKAAASVQLEREKGNGL